MGEKNGRGNENLQKGGIRQIMGIRELTDDWAPRRYEDGFKMLESSGEYSERTIERLKHCLIKLNRYKFKKMDGNSVGNLIKYDDAEKYEGIRFSGIINEIKDDKKFTPVKYLAQIEEMCDDRGLNEEMTIGLLARGLRILPSFLREIDMEEQLKNALKRREMNSEISRNPEMDVKEHTDIFVNIGDKKYRIWLFQNSDRGISNTKSRLRGERGEVSCGIHILCPMNPINARGRDQKYIDRNGWRFYSESYVKEIVDFMENLIIEEIPTYREFLYNMNLSEEEIQAFKK